MEEERFSRSFVIKTALIVMCLSVIASLFISMLFFYSYFSSSYSEYGEFIKVHNVIERNYYSDYDKQKLMDSACHGLVDGLDDKYSEYLSEDELKVVLGNITSEYVGIGITVSQSGDGNIKISEVAKDSSAEKAGITVGDVITHVDGVSVSGVGSNEALKLIKAGDAGSSVVLTVSRDGQSLDFTVVRESMHEETVFYSMLENNIAYISIKKFNTDTGDLFEKSLETAVSRGAEKLIIDLRNNPGGEAEAAKQVADALLDKCTMYYSVDKSGKKDVVEAEDGSVGLPAVLLINGSSASASELVTGALRDNGRVYIVGQKTYGKGVIQGIFSLSETSALKLTIAEYFTPSGDKVNGVGIAPDYEITPAEGMVIGDITSDNQLRYAASYLNGEADE